MTVKRVNYVKDQEQNWNTFKQNHKQSDFNPFSGTTALAAGFGNVASTTGFYFVWGPVVFFSISLTSASTLTWGANSTLKLPFGAARTSTGTLVQNGLMFEVTYPSSGSAKTVGPFFSPKSGPQTLVFKDKFRLNATTLTAENGNQGAGTNINISGWYFRE